MVLRAVAVVVVAGLLGGCTDADWDHALSYAGLDSGKPAPAQPAASPQAQPDQPATVTAQADAPPDGWCAEVANAARTEAAGDGFDQATQEHRASQAFQQCGRAGSTMQ